MSDGTDASDQGALFDAEIAIEGRVGRVVFHAEDTGFTVLTLEPDPPIEGVGGPVRVVGHVGALEPGEHVRARGRWVEDKTYGRQIRATLIRRGPPASSEAIGAYLASGVLDGVGPAIADRLLHRFGAKIFEVIEHSPEKLEEVEGIGPAKAAKIKESWESARRDKDAMLLLHEAGVGQALAGRIQKTFGERAVAVVQSDPYRLAREVKGVGFRTADQIARAFSHDPRSQGRIDAGILHALGEAAIQDGHCALDRAVLIDRARALLDLDRAAIEERIASLARSLDLVIEDGDRVFSRELHEAETQIAQRLGAIAEGPAPWPTFDVARMIDEAEARTQITLSDDQRAAVRAALAAKIAIVTGGPGVGKTTIVQVILDALEASGIETALCAPTGRAAKRLSESAGRPAATIHRLLGVRPGVDGFRKDGDDPLSCDLLVVDEMSMVDAPLFRALLEALPDRAALLMVGDVDQLPSVGPGQVLADLIASGAIAVRRLERVHRQAAASRIVAAAHAINKGDLPALDPTAEGDFFFVAVEDPARAQRLLVEMVATRIPARFGLDPIREIQTLSPMNRGALGADGLNDALQAALRPNAGQGVSLRGKALRLGDKVIQRVNDYERDVYNGDIGVIESVDREARALEVRFEDRVIAYEGEDLDALALAYAITIHKAQGSEYPAVVAVLHKQHWTMLRRDLLYTAITRGKRLVVLLGSREALSRAVFENPARRRQTRLASRIAERLEAVREAREAGIDWED